MAVDANEISFVSEIIVQYLNDLGYEVPDHVKKVCNQMQKCGLEPEEIKEIITERVKRTADLSS